MSAKELTSNELHEQIIEFSDQVHDLMIANDSIERATKEFTDENLRELDIKMTAILTGIDELHDWVKEKLAQ